MKKFIFTILCLFMFFVFTGTEVNAKPIESVIDPGGGGTVTDYDGVQPVNTNVTYTGRIDFAGDSDYFSFSLEKPACVSIEMQYIYTDYATELEVFYDNPYFPYYETIFTPETGYTTNIFVLPKAEYEFELSTYYAQQPEGVYTIRVNEFACELENTGMTADLMYLGGYAFDLMNTKWEIYNLASNDNELKLDDDILFLHLPNTDVFFPIDNDIAFFRSYDDGYAYYLKIDEDVYKNNYCFGSDCFTDNNDPTEYGLVSVVNTGVTYLKFIPGSYILMNGDDVIKAGLVCYVNPTLLSPGLLLYTSEINESGDVVVEYALLENFASYSYSSDVEIDSPLDFLEVYDTITLFSEGINIIHANEDVDWVVKILENDEALLDNVILSSYLPYNMDE